MRTYGPIIAVGFYMTQLLHAFLFFTVFGPALHEQFASYPTLAYWWQLLGWFLCYKVTYLYYRVSTSSPGVPSEQLKKTKATKKSDDKLPLNE
mmetsp:Transcript_44675/g.59271  ORF Transcript_44675/g.59271 Transcript_44675/m.59271 type:complete len:93 (-) Transcript_44675:866-1144(-)